MSNKSNITDMPYAQWLEQTLREISSLPVKGIALVGVLDGRDAYSSYYEVPMADKLLLAGIINQDAMMDVLAENGVIEYVDDEEIEEDNANGEEEE